MYNGTGLQSPGGSGTSCYTQSNKSFKKPKGPTAVTDSTSKGFEEEEANAAAAAAEALVDAAVGPSIVSGTNSSQKLPPAEDETDRVFGSFYGIQSIPSTQDPGPGAIFIFEKASLVPALVGRNHQVLNPEHADFLRKKNLNPYDYRPDIVHEVLVNLIGSRLNMARRVQAVYVKTDKGSRQPYAYLTAQLFQSLSVRARGKGGKLMQLVQNPVTQHLPANSRIIGLSHSAKKATNVRDYVRSMNKNQTPVFVVGAMAHGKIDDDYTEDLISVSDMPLSAGVCVRKICVALERRGKII